MRELPHNRRAYFPSALLRFIGRYIYSWTQGLQSILRQAYLFVGFFRRCETDRAQQDSRMQQLSNEVYSLRTRLENLERAQGTR